MVKVNAIYRTPFWRDGGLNGGATSEVGPIRVTYDNSPPDGHPGVLVGFMEGDDSRAFYGVSPAALRHAALRSFTRYFGPEARTRSGMWISRGRRSRSPAGRTGASTRPAC